jgi:hypothetical protein
MVSAPQSLQARAALQFLSHCVRFYRHIAIGNTDGELAHNALRRLAPRLFFIRSVTADDTRPVSAALALGGRTREQGHRGRC